MIKVRPKIQKTGSLLMQPAVASSLITIAQPAPYRQEFTYVSSLPEPLTAKVYSASHLKPSLLEDIIKLRSQVGSPKDLRTDPTYLLGFGNTTKRRPVVIALYAGKGLRCVVVFRELMLGPLHLGIYLVGDIVGDGDILCAASDRVKNLEVAIKALFRCRRAAHTVRICMAANDPCDFPQVQPFAVAQVRRQVKRRLILKPTFEQMLNSFGRNTRRHFQRNRVRLETSGEISFLPSLSAQKAFEGMVALGHVSGVFRNLEQHKNRFAMLATHSHSYCMGLQRNGEWLSIISGWRDGTRSFVDLQMNNHLYEKQSISAVMRSYMLEHEIAGQQQDLIFVGGTSALLQRYCIEDEACLDVLIRRNNLRGRSSERIVKRLAPKALRQFLFSPEMSATDVENSCTDEIMREMTL